MQLIDVIIGFQQPTLAVTPLPGSALNFSPAKLLFLIAWVYLCLFCVQRTQFSTLVSRGNKTLAAILSLVAGPVVFFFLLIYEVISKRKQGEITAIDIILDRITGIFSGFGSSALFKGKDNTVIKLTDTSGRNIQDVLGHGNKKGTQDRRILNLTEDIIWNGIIERASDILIDPKGNGTYTIRFRVDGVLREFDQIETDTAQAVVNSIKAVAGMDIAERRRPQDGAFLAKTDVLSASLRAASAGVVNGEKLSLRVLNQDASKFTLESVGFNSRQVATLNAFIKQPSGLILVCGPTGSGKTTTLFSMLNNIDLFTRNVITVEDPIEYVLPNASQIEVNPKADITFAKSLRSILRQDPDVICIGEIRDEETAEIALRAAQTGHLVLSTVHCQSNAGAMVRLWDMGVSPLLMSSALNVIISQRLLRRLCENCKQKAQLTETQKYDFKKRKINYTGFCQAQGCQYCGGTGYYERIAVFDFLILDKVLKNNIANGKISAAQLKTEGDKKGKSNLYKQGLKQVVAGTTSFDELKRVIG